MDSAAKPEGAELIIDEESPTVRKFVAMLEQRMLEGHSEASNRTWATLDLGVPLEKFNQIQAIVLKGWRLAGLPADVARQQRDIIRQQYQYLYKEALSKHKLKEALHALDALVKLDGLDVPPEGSLEAGVVGGMITNAARAELAELMKRARSLAERGVPKPIALPPGNENGANGHSRDSNGHDVPMIIDLREAKK